MIKLKILDKELTINEAKKLYDELAEIFNKKYDVFELFDEPNLPKPKFVPEPPFVPGTKIVDSGPLATSDSNTDASDPTKKWYGEYNVSDPDGLDG